MKKALSLAGKKIYWVQHQAPSAKYNKAFVIFGILQTVFGSYLAWSTGRIWAMIVCSILILAWIFAGIKSFFAPLPRLVISPNYIEFHDWGYVIRSPWENIKLIYRHFNEQKMRLSELAPSSTNWLRFLSTNADENGKFIPLSLFDANWQETELGQDLRKFVPRLFTNDSE